MLFVANLTTAATAFIFYFKVHELEAGRMRLQATERLNRLLGRGAGATAGGAGAGGSRQYEGKEADKDAHEGSKDEEEGLSAHQLRLLRPTSSKEVVPAARRPSAAARFGHAQVHVGGGPDPDADVEGKREAALHSRVTTVSVAALNVNADASHGRPFVATAAPFLMDEDEETPLSLTNPSRKKRRGERSELPPILDTKKIVLPAPLDALATASVLRLTSAPPPNTDAGATVTDIPTEATHN